MKIVSNGGVKDERGRLAIIELSTGKVTEVNAGHEHPILYRDGEYGLVKYPHSLPVAARKNGLREQILCC